MKFNLPRIGMLKVLLDCSAVVATNTGRGGAGNSVVAVVVSRPGSCLEMLVDFTKDLIGWATGRESEQMHCPPFYNSGILNSKWVGDLLQLLQPELVVFDEFRRYYITKRGLSEDTGEFEEMLQRLRSFHSSKNNLQGIPKWMENFAKRLQRFEKVRFRAFYFSRESMTEESQRVARLWEEFEDLPPHSNEGMSEELKDFLDARKNKPQWMPDEIADFELMFEMLDEFWVFGKRLDAMSPKFQEFERVFREFRREFYSEKMEVVPESVCAAMTERLRRLIFW